MWVLISGMMGCPFVGPEAYETRVMDADGDGGISVRFGGADCLDADPSIADCDQDGDGALALNAGGEDCDDLDASVHPGVQEVCSGRDDDCDGLIDDLDDSISGQPTVWLDADNDEVGGEVGLASCETPEGYVLVSGDCDDNDPSISPNILESCDEVDHNCDGLPREGATNPIDWFEDVDGDTFGGALSGTSCEPPDPSDVSNDSDCDDADPSATTPRVWYFDGDGDGRGVATQTVQACVAPAEHSLIGDDCDDNNPNRFPGALEACDGVDNDCDGLVDDDDTDVFSPPTWYADADGDGVPNVLVPAVQCIPPSGFIPFVGLEDCNDGDAAIHPNQVEQCDETGTDDDCDGLVNEDDPDYRGIAYFLDGDADGFGAGPGVIACIAPAGYSDRDGDCNDANPLIHPVTMWFADLDGDGFGDAAASTVACNPPGLWALDPLDCDDSDALVGDPVAHGVDGDGDGFPGGGTAVTFWCLGDAPGGEAPLVGVQIDCLDTNAGVNPGAQEVYYDGVDINCDPADEFDADGDGVECNWLVDLRCPNEPGVGDCDDSDPLVGPGMPEVVFYDGVDQDCDGDDWDQDGDGWLATPPATWLVPYFDADADDDGLVDAVEQLGYGTDPLLSDTDGDGVPDGMELAGGTDPLVPEIHNLMGDPDGDGLNAAEELIAGTSPIDRDSDDDGVLDGDEVDVHLTDPLVADFDCNDLDPRSFPQQFDFDGASASRNDLGPLGCAVGAVQTLQELIDCNCDGCGSVDVSLLTMHV